MSEQFETKPKVGLSAELLEKIRLRFAQELEQRAAASGLYAKFLGPDIGERVICGEKVRRGGATEIVLREVTRDFQLKPEEVDWLMGELFGSIL